MNNTDKEYQRLLDLILTKGKKKQNRTGTPTIGVFGAQARFDLSEGFPLLTTKKVAFNAIVHELLWFISGSTNIKYLVDNNVHIWDGDAFRNYNTNKPKKGGILLVDQLLLTNQEKRVQKGEPIETDKPVITQVKENIVNKQKAFIERIKNDAEFAKEWGELGQGTYGQMWRAFPVCIEDTEFEKNHPNAEFDGNASEVNYTKFWCAETSCWGMVDQLQKVIDKLKTNPDDRRMIVSAWHPYWADHCALPPCHCLFHFNTEELTFKERWDIGWGGKVVDMNDLVETRDWDDQKHEHFFNGLFDGAKIPKRRLNCLLYQRSCDTFLGVPFNIASYSLLTMMIAQTVNMVPGEFIHTYGDLHLYENHIEQAKIQLAREPKKLPNIVLNPNIKNLFDFKFENIKLENYDPHPAIKGEVSVG